MNDQIENWLSSERYAKGAAKLSAEFAELNSALVSSDPQKRLSATRRLSTLSRSELSWFLLPVREYFLEPTTQRLIAESFRLETETKTRDRMLNTLRHASEQFVEHPMWTPKKSQIDHDAWRLWVHGIAESFAGDRRSSTRAEAAYLLALCGDPRAWALFLDEVRRRPGALTMLHDAVVRYPSSITPELRASILLLAEEVGAADPRQAYAADGIRTALVGMLA